MIDEKIIRAELQNIQKYFEAKMDMTIGDGKLKMACWARTCHDALELLKEQQPAADAVPVVRCKDCMFYNTSGRPDGLGWCETSRIYNIVRDDFYCGDGKK